MSAQAAAGMSPLKELITGVQELMKSLDPLAINSDKAHPVKLGFFDYRVSTYLVFFMLAVVLTLALVFWAKKRIALVPKGRAINAFELVVGFARDNIVGGVIHKDPEKYTPIVLTVFFFILVSNLMGLIPGFKPGTGTISATAAMALTVFVYFTGVGIRANGGFGYLGTLVPHGLPKPIVPLVFVIEFASMIMKPITHALRLFANMYAGHIILGVFALMTELFVVAPFMGGNVFNIAAAPIWFALLCLLYALEIVVALIQAYVFALLTAVYINSALGSH